MSQSEIGGLIVIGIEQWDKYSIQLPRHFEFVFVQGCNGRILENLEVFVIWLCVRITNSPDKRVVNTHIIK